MNIIEALDDPVLFANHFKGDTWGPWRTVLKALFALPMDEAEAALYQACTGRTEAPTEPFKEAALVCGRRAGKSRQLSLIATYLACFRNYAPYLAPGEMATVAIIAADRKQARVVFRYIEGLLQAVPMLKALIEDTTAETITLSNRVILEVHTASFRVTRGYSFAAVLADETSFWRSDETSAVPDTEIFRALRPGMSSIPGAILLNASSPYRRQGELWKTYQRGYGKDDARTLVWQASTEVMNPAVDKSIIQEAYVDDPESAASEYGALFRSDIADFLSRQIVEACVESGCYERPPARAAGNYRVFIDAAGGSGSDSMTMAITHLESSGTDRIPILDVVRERRPPFSPDEVVREFSLLMKSYGVSRATSDKWGGDWVIEAFRKHNITVEPHAAPKSDIYRELLPLLNARRCSLLDNPRLISQLCGLERRVARGGRDSIDHSPGGHDDLANAAAGALLLANVHRPMKINAESLRQLLNSPPMPGSPNYRRYGGPDPGRPIA